MLNNKYLVRIEGKNPHRFFLSLVKMHLEFLQVKEENDYLEVWVDEKNYERLIDIKTIYEIKLVKIKGIKAVTEEIKKKKFFFISLIVGLFLLLFLSNIIFDVEVVHTKKEIRDLLYEELDNYGIKRLHFCISFEKKEKIREEILEKHKDTLEWIEIERVGTKYIVRVEERKLNKEEEPLEIRDIVAKKDGLITKIESSKGEIVAKKNQYVKKGDLLITGAIHNKEEVKEYVASTGTVMAETWYKVTVSMPLSYHEEKKTGNKKQLLGITFLNHHFSLFDFKPYKDKKREEKALIKNSLFPLSIDWVIEEELEVIDQHYTKEEAIEEAKKRASEKLLSSLGENDRILFQKDLKITEEDSKIIVEVFLKVEEDITAYQKLTPTDMNKDKKE